MSSNALNRSRLLRQNETTTEKLLWSALRARQICGLKFRRQHNIGPFFADFVCIKHRLIVEVDGGYHNTVITSDTRRERYLYNNGWDILRVTTLQVKENPEGIGYLIAQHLGLEYSFRRRSGGGSGEKKRR